LRSAQRVPSRFRRRRRATRLRRRRRLQEVARRYCQSTLAPPLRRVRTNSEAETCRAAAVLFRPRASVRQLRVTHGWRSRLRRWANPSAECWNTLSTIARSSTASGASRTATAFSGAKTHPPRRRGCARAGCGSVSKGRALPGSLNLDGHPHPGMNTALKMMGAL
jgi:hypothetical protein